MALSILHVHCLEIQLEYYLGFKALKKVIERKSFLGSENVIYLKISSIQYQQTRKDC